MLFDYFRNKINYILGQFIYKDNLIGKISVNYYLMILEIKIEKFNSVLIIYL